MAKINLNTNYRNPAWDFQYMKECVTSVAAVAYQCYALTEEGKHCIL